MSYGDLYFNDDPDGIDPGQRRGGRTDHAYVSARFGPVGVMLGRMKRNWSTWDADGLELEIGVG